MVTVGEILDLEPDGELSFIGRSPTDREGTVFGGQLVSQALVAACRTVEEGRLPHSVHALYLRAGDPKAPLRYEVAVVRDGRGFSSRQVTAHQHGKEALKLLASFQVATDGPDFELCAEPEALVADPTTLATYGSWLAATSSNPEHHAIGNPGPVDIRLANPPDSGVGEPVARPELDLWMRIDGELPNDPALHAAAVVWLTDKAVGDHVTLPHGRRWTDEGVDSISIDHAVWLHRPTKADEWLLYRQSVVSTCAMRGLARGEIYSADGHHVASVAQEAVIRLPD